MPQNEQYLGHISQMHEWAEEDNDSFLKPTFLRPKSLAERGKSPQFLVLLQLDPPEPQES